MVVSKKKRSNVVKRKGIRFKPEQNTLAWVSRNATKFSKDIVCLVDSESMMGCGLVINLNTGLEEGEKCMVGIGDLEPLKAQVRWIHQVDVNLYRIGFRFLE